MGATFSFLSVLIFRKNRPDFGIIQWRVLLNYSLPLSAHAFCTWAVCYADRIVLGKFVGLADIGVYHIGYLLATVVSTISLSVKNAWLPDFFKSAQEDQRDGSVFSSWLVSYYAFVLSLVMGMVCLGPPLSEIFLSREYSESMVILRLVAISLIFHAILVALLNPLYFCCRTKTVALISASSLLANVLSMYLLVPIIGIRGAACSTIVAYAFAMVLAYWQVRKHYEMQIRWDYVSRSTLLFAFMVILSLVTFEHWWMRLLWGTGCFLAYNATSIFTPGLFVRDEDRELIAIGLKRIEKKLGFKSA